MKFEEILRDAKNKVFHPVYFLFGEETFFIDEITNYLDQNILDEASKSFNQTVVYGRDVKAREVVDLARRFPMMGNYQVVILKEAQVMLDIEDLNLYLENMLDTTILIINYKHKKPDGRKKFFKHLKKSPQAVYFEAKKLYDNQVPAWIGRTVKMMGYNITPMACELLSEYIGADLNNQANEIGKLIINLEDGATITEEMVSDNIGIIKDFSIFELQKAFAKRDVLKAQRIVQYYEANPKEHPLQMLTVMLNNFWVKVFLVHQFKGADNRTIASEVGVTPFHLGDYTMAARNYSPGRIADIISAIRTVDVKARGLGISDAKSYGPLKELVFGILNNTPFSA